jgi:hypothetical protein
MYLIKLFHLKIHRMLENSLVTPHSPKIKLLIDKDHGYTRNRWFGYIPNTLQEH